MNLWLLVGTLAAAVAAVASAVVAIVQAARARRSETDAATARNEARAARDESVRLAGLATDAFIRQAEAQEKANTIREDELRPPDWTGPQLVSGDLRRVINSSRRTIVVERFEVEPDHSEGMIRVSGKDDGVYKYGDAFTYMVSSRFTARSPEKLTVFYRFEDEPSDDLRDLIIPL